VSKMKSSKPKVMFERVPGVGAKRAISLALEVRRYRPDLPAPK
jgi:hypothetical protein